MLKICVDDSRRTVAVSPNSTVDDVIHLMKKKLVLEEELAQYALFQQNLDDNTGKRIK